MTVYLLNIPQVSTYIPMTVVFVLFIIFFFLGQYSVHGIKPIELNSNKGQQICEAAEKIQKWFGPYYAFFTIGLGIVVAIFITNSSEVFRLHSDEYSWFSFDEHVRFISDQIVMQETQKVKVVRNENALEDKTGNYYNVLLTDWSPSTNNDLERQLSVKLNKYIPHAEYSLLNCNAFMNQPDSSFKMNLPLLMLANLISTHKDINSRVSFLAYFGDNTFDQQLFGNRWNKCSDVTDFCNGGETSFVQRYFSTVRRCKEYDAQHGAGNVRTDFATIIDRINSTLEDAPGLNELHKDDYVCINIISDFLHDEFFQSQDRARSRIIGFDKIDERLGKLFSRQYIKQVNLIQVPGNKNDSIKISTLIKKIESSNSGNGKYFEHIAANSLVFADDEDAVQKILAATRNYEINNSYGHLDFYHNLNGETSDDANGSIAGLAEMDFDGVVHNAENLHFKLRSSQDNNPEMSVRVAKFPADPNAIPVNGTGWTSISVVPNDTLCWKVRSPYTAGGRIYLDFYSSTTHIKRSIALCFKPFLPMEIGIPLIELYFVTFLFACIIFSCYTFHIVNHFRGFKRWVVAVFAVIFLCTSYIVWDFARLLLKYAIVFWKIDFWLSLSFIGIFLLFIVIVIDHFRTLHRLKCGPRVLIVPAPRQIPNY